MSLLSEALITFAWPPSLQVSDLHRHTMLIDYEHFELITMCFVVSVPCISGEELLIGQSSIAHNKTRLLCIMHLDIT